MDPIKVNIELSVFEIGLLREAVERILNTAQDTHGELIVLFNRLWKQEIVGTARLLIQQIDDAEHEPDSSKLQSLLEEAQINIEQLVGLVTQ